MKTMIIYRNKDDQIIDVTFKSEEMTYDELRNKITEYNNIGENKATTEAIPDYLYDVILFHKKVIDNHLNESL